MIKFPWLSVPFIKGMFPLSAGKTARSARMIEKYGPIVIRAIEDGHIEDSRFPLVVLATIRAETEGFEPIKEMISKYNTPPGGEPYSLYNNRSDLGNTHPGDGAKYPGRGFPQLTGLDNYTRYGALVGVDLVGKPELACDPELSAYILCGFVTNHWPAISTALDNESLSSARKQVNGGIAGLIRFVDAYNLGLAAYYNTSWGKLAKAKT
jgi:hypothetical protein